MIKIGLIIYGSLDTISGGYLYDRKLVEYLRQQGDTVEIISLPWRNYAAHLTDNLLFRLPRDFDLIIEDELNHPSLIAANQGKHLYPVVSLVHHLRCSESRPKWQKLFYRWIEKRFLDSVDGFIFNSKTTKGATSRLVGNDKPSVIAYPPTDRFGEAISENEIIERANGKELKILFLGNVIERKGLHVLLEALARVGRDSISSYKLDVVGSSISEPKYAQAIQEKVEVLGLTSTVFFHGALDNQPLIEMYTQSHLMVVPSSYEGFGIVYLEGMGFGLPAIGTTAGAAGEIITHGDDGYLIQPEDTNALTGYIHELASNRELLLKLSLNAVKRYKVQPKWEETAKFIREFLYKMARRSLVVE